jgi:tRNA-Thr(GGU) m(6)t(6)A37 methyltransferase TsaA
MKLEFKPIGIIHSPYKAVGDAPHQGIHSKAIATIEVNSEYEEGLKDIDGFSHILVLYGFHQSKGYSLIANTPWDKMPHGVFATRSPNRPNPIGVCVVSLVGRKGRILRVKGIDAIDGSPLLDIKPYIMNIDEVSEVRLGWSKNKVQHHSPRKTE